MIIAAATAGLFIAACGSDDTFTRDFNQAQKPLERVLADVGSPGTDGAKIERIADELDDTASAMRKLSPPSDAKDELAAFITEVESGADAMHRVSKAVSSGEPERMTAALGTLQEHMTGVATAQQALETAVN